MKATELRFVRSVIALNVRRPSHPLKVSFAVTWRCNLACRMCNIWRKPPGKELTVAEVDRFFSLANRFHWIGFTGGEPFLRPDLAEVVDVAVRRCTDLDSIHFNTNGRRPERVIEVVEGIRRRHPRLRMVLTVSLDGPPDIHDRIRGKEGTWDRAVATFRAVKALPSVKAQIGYTVCPDNLGQFGRAWEALGEACHDLTFDDLNVNVFQTSGHYYDNQGLGDPDPEALRREIDLILAMDRDGFTVNSFLRRRYLALYKRFLAERKSPLTCQALSATCFLDPEGDLYPCIVYKRPLGNVRELPGPFTSWWRSPAVAKVARECSGGRCPGCWSPCDAFSAIGGSLLKAALVR